MARGLSDVSWAPLQPEDAKKNDNVSSLPTVSTVAFLPST